MAGGGGSSAGKQDLFEDSVAGFLAPVKQYLDDPAVSEILINGPDEVFIERGGKLEKTDAKFRDEQALQSAVRNIAQFVGRKIDERNLILDGRLPNGSRVAAVLPPCSFKGTTLSIRKFGTKVPKFVDLINWGSISQDAARFLDVAIFLAKNMIISGGTGSGKTSLLNVLGSRIPKDQRLLIIEDAKELKITADHVVFFETRKADVDHPDLPEVSVRDLLKSALRLRPDRIVVGEVRGDEALDLVAAMNTGHGGSMGTTHANTPFDALVRLETLAMSGGTKIPEQAIRRQIISAIHVVVQIKRLDDGSRKVTHISEVHPELDEQGKYMVNDIFRFVQRGKSQEGKIIGELVPTGRLPSFMDEIEVNRLPFPREKFTPPEWYVEHVKKQRQQAA